MITLHSVVGLWVRGTTHSLDIEGAELVALQSLHLGRVGIGIIFVECDRSDELKNLALRAILGGKGYEHLMEKDRSCWFYNRGFAAIYSLAKPLR
mmetsp:Transcript_53168/g.161526  ORF Transcript_53168/g.161526 Transcript_53168/m.161526 type:complete len:95 (+) Transcript_53168:64-348(+)